MIHSERLAQTIALALPQILVRPEEPMARHTTFRIGGPAECMAFPRTEQELQQLLRFARERACPVLLLGGGSNLLAPDEGLRGLVIETRSGLRALQNPEPEVLTAQCGLSLAALSGAAAERGLCGLAFAQGIPGTVGGGVYMNAGAYGGEMAGAVRSVRALNPADGTVRTLSGAELAFGYRRSAFMQTGEIVLQAEFRLERGERAEILAEMEELARRRREKQPLDLPSAGSAFRRPAQGYAAAMIDEAGLRGLRVGGAAVSEKHAGFIVNLGGATAEDVRRLIGEVQKRVYARTGVLLEPEIRLL